jgi:hypothetical protein
MVLGKQQSKSIPVSMMLGKENSKSTPIWDKAL